MEIRILGDITPASVRPILHALDQADRDDPVDVIVNSNGGETGAALEIADHLRNFDDTNATICGQCASAAILVLAACRRRSAPVSARFHFHTSSILDPLSIGRLTADTLRASADGLLQTDHLVRRRIAEWTGVDRELLSQWEIKEKVATATEMYQVGMLTSIFGEGSTDIRLARFRQIIAAARREEAVAAAQDCANRREELGIREVAAAVSASASRSAAIGMPAEAFRDWADQRPGDPRKLLHLVGGTR